MAQVLVEKLHTLTGHHDGVYALQSGSLPSVFFSGAGDGMVVMWNLDRPDEGQLIARLPHSIYALHYLKKEDIIVAGNNYDGIHWLNWKDRKEDGSLHLSTSAIFDIQSFEGHLLIATGDGVIFIVNSATRAIEKKLAETDKSARSIAINHARGEFAVGYSDNFIRVFSLVDWKLKQAWMAHTNSVFSLTYSPDGQFLISGSRDARLKAWDVAAGYTLANEVVAHLFAINHVAFSQDGKHFVTCSMDKSIKVWDAAEMKLLKVIDKARHAGHGTSVNRLLWTPFFNLLVSASDDRTISVWKLIF